MIPNSMDNYCASFYSASVSGVLHSCSLSPPWNSSRSIQASTILVVFLPHEQFFLHSHLTHLSVEPCSGLRLWSPLLCPQSFPWWSQPVLPILKNQQTKDFQMYISRPNLSSKLQIDVFKCLHDITCSKSNSETCSAPPSTSVYANSIFSVAQVKWLRANLRPLSLTP